LLITSVHTMGKDNYSAYPPAGYGV
jgi:hypothetical protein